jgi:DNA-binding NarL/FixJ family response regulator
MNGMPIRVLLVEDNPGDARLLQEMLNEPGSIKTELTHCGLMNDAVNHLATNTVDIILLDLGLPDVGRLGAVRQMHAAAPSVPLVVLTGLDDESLAIQTLQEGAQDYLIKGKIGVPALLRVMRYAIERRRIQSETDLIRTPQMQFKDEFLSHASHAIVTPAIAAPRALPGPQTLADLGVPRGLCEDLAVKILYLEGELSLLELASKMHIALAIVEEIFERMRKSQFCEVRGAVGNIRRIAATNQGKARAVDLLSHSQYAGPVPVPLDDYNRQVRAQSVTDLEVGAGRVERAFAGLVLGKQTLAQLGAALVSGRATMLYGPAGTGKTAIAQALPGIYEDLVLIPHAVEVDNQIITVFDSHIHQPSDLPESPDDDRRWILCRRPAVIVGGEMTAEMLDLQLNSASGFYSAPLQMKANNGVLIVDDFGRQRMRPEDLINRWIVPLDQKIDFLTLVGGKKFEIPFDIFVVFATNLDPSRLADESFLRRIQTKVKVDYMQPPEFHQIFRGACGELGLAYDADMVDHLIALLATMGQPLRACFPRDIIRSICAAARYENCAPRLDHDAISRACDYYFLVT